MEEFDSLEQVIPFLTREDLENLAISSLVKVKQQNKQLIEKENASLFDEQTGLYNDRYFLTKLMPKLKKHVVRDRRSVSKTTVFGFIDVDETDRFNREFGHDGCDTIIEIIAEVFRNETRGTGDIVGRRYGQGDEFYVLLNIDSKEGIDIHRAIESFVDRCRQQVQLAFDGYVNFSSGFTIVCKCKSAKDVIKEADSKMFIDKETHKE
ncbi:MAG TPA: diguanylate cyclase [Patescibacteria group bacterium]|nr:diguanylate cyclase [Patescibacteria group bacterium]